MRACLYYNAPYGEILCRFLRVELGDTIANLMHQDLNECGFIGFMDDMLGTINLALLNGIEPTSNEAKDLWDLNNVK